MIEEIEVKDLQKAVYELVTQKNYDEAFPLINELLEFNPNDAVTLNFLGVIHLDLQNFHLAYQYFRRGLQENPNMCPLWANFGLSAYELGREKEAMSSYLKAVELDNGYFKAYDNAAALLIGQSKWDDAQKMCELSLEVSSEGKLANKNLAHVYLARHQWKKGWEHWDLSLGNKYRKEWSYGDEPRWDGPKDQCVVIYGEQGLGDEISYASCVPDAITDCKKVIIDCDVRLESLYRRSFPKADVYGTRRDEKPKWLQTAKIDARVAISSLPGIYRNTDESFPGTPYLKADPELTYMFKSMWGDKMAYGLCLHGGSKLTNERGRKITPEQFSPLFSGDSIFVSLDYKGCLDSKIIKQFPWATQTKNYDLTAALIASLDAVVGVNTTAMHCANALGVPTHMLIPEFYQWRYEGEYLWSKTATLYHQGKDENWREVIKRVKL